LLEHFDIFATLSYQRRHFGVQFRELRRVVLIHPVLGLPGEDL
jgi:hypothetical protein